MDWGPPIWFVWAWFEDGKWEVVLWAWVKYGGHLVNGILRYESKTGVWKVLRAEKQKKLNR